VGEEGVTGKGVRFRIVCIVCYHLHKGRSAYIYLLAQEKTNNNWAMLGWIQEFCYISFWIVDHLNDFFPKTKPRLQKKKKASKLILLFTSSKIISFLWLLSYDKYSALLLYSQQFLEKKTVKFIFGFVAPLTQCIKHSRVWRS
jgi:hypothetical protein